MHFIMILSIFQKVNESISSDNKYNKTGVPKGRTEDVLMCVRVCVCAEEMCVRVSECCVFASFFLHLKVKLR